MVNVSPNRLSLLLVCFAETEEGFLTVDGEKLIFENVSKPVSTKPVWLLDKWSDCNSSCSAKKGIERRQVSCSKPGECKSQKPGTTRECFAGEFITKFKLCLHWQLSLLLLSRDATKNTKFSIFVVVASDLMLL